MMLADWLYWVSVVSTVVGLFALPPLAYRFIVAWWWPFEVVYRPYPRFGTGALAGSPLQLLVDIHNRTPDVAQFYLYAMFSSAKVGSFLPVTYWITDFPANARLPPPIKLGPLEKRHLSVYLIPHRRGTIDFKLQFVEFFHPETYPRWLRIRRTLFRMKAPTLRPLQYEYSVSLLVEGWAIPREKIADWIGRPLTPEEVKADDAYSPDKTS